MDRPRYLSWSVVLSAAAALSAGCESRHPSPPPTAQHSVRQPELLNVRSAAGERLRRIDSTRVIVAGYPAQPVGQPWEADQLALAPKRPAAPQPVAVQVARETRSPAK